MTEKDKRKILTNRNSIKINKRIMFCSNLNTIKKEKKKRKCRELRI